MYGLAREGEGVFGGDGGRHSERVRWSKRRPSSGLVVCVAWLGGVELEEVEVPWMRYLFSVQHCN